MNDGIFCSLTYTSVDKVVQKILELGPQGYVPRIAPPYGMLGKRTCLALGA